MPKEIIITALRHDGNSFLVEFRHKEEEAFYQLAGYALAVEFTTAEIKTRETEDNVENM